MAKLAVDRLVEREARTAPCRTDEIPLGQAIDAAELPRVEGVPDNAYEHVARRYGHAAREVLAIAAERGELAQPIVTAAPPDLLAEVVHAARHEQVTSVGDALLRRTRVGLLAARAVADRAGETGRRVALAMAHELGWEPARAEAEARAFLDEATAEGIVTDP
jgi:glycerol-3-phosphate dehydrogenase